MASVASVVVLCAFASGCTKTVRFVPSQIARGGKASVKIELTYDRNDRLEVKLTNVPEPSSIKPDYTRYVLWIETPDRSHVINVGQLRVDEKRNAAIGTLTPLRTFRLLITAEAAGDTFTPGPDTVFESDTVNW